MNRARPGQIIGYRRSGAPIRLIAGAADGDGGDGDGSDGLGDLIDGGDSGSGDGDGGDGGDGDGGDNGSGSAPPAWWGPASTTLQTTIQQATTAEIDRRINQLVNRRRGNNQGSGQGQGQGQGQGDDDGQHSRQRVGGGVDAGDIRDARAVAREAISDSGVRLTPEEREMLGDYLAGAIVTGLARDNDPDVVGNSVATAFIGKVKKLRGSYQKRIVNRLVTQGVLDKEKLKPGQRQGGSSTQGQKLNADWQSGADKAKEMLTRSGRLPADQQNSSTRN